MIIGHIVCDSEIKMTGFSHSFDFQFKKGIPTIIVGWKVAKLIGGGTFNINNMQIDDDLFWSVEESVNRDLYLSNIEQFKAMCINKVISSYKIEYFDLWLKEASELDFSDVKLVLSRANNYYMRKMKSIVIVSKDLDEKFGKLIISQINSSGVRVIKNTLNPFKVEDRHLLCFFEL
jgi:hypothetical protein